MAVLAQADRFTIPMQVRRDLSVQIAALRADVRLYFDVPFDEIADDFLPVFDDLWTWSGRSEHRWWRHEEMPLYEPVRARTHTVLASVLRRGLPRDVGVFEAKAVDPAAGDDARFVVADKAVSAQWYTKGGTFGGLAAGEVRVLDRWQRMLENPDEWLARVLATCDALPVKSGVSGFVAEHEGLMGADMAVLYGAAMRHVGVDLDNDWTLAMAAPNAIKGVNWLTVLGRGAVDQLGGVQALRRAVGDAATVHEVRHAVVLQAGPTPQLGDTNRGDRLPAYGTVYAAVKDLHEPMISEAIPFQMGRPDDADRTEAWLRRFDPGRP